jgi:hypothetical protein
MKQINKLKLTQLMLAKELIEKASINIVTCGNCGAVILHKVNDFEITCYDCEFTSEPCDFPDLWYNGVEIH